MLTIISFLLTLIGSVNWLLIGLLQYDFVAGIFGYQASVFSRIIYIIIGASSIILVYKLIKGKGTLAVFSRRNKKDLAKNIEKMQTQSSSQSSESDRGSYVRSNADVEASRELGISDEERNYRNSYEKGLFNEHFDERHNDKYD